MGSTEPGGVGIVCAGSVTSVVVAVTVGSVAPVVVSVTAGSVAGCGIGSGTGSGTGGGVILVPALIASKGLGLSLSSAAPGSPLGTSTLWPSGP